MTSKYCKVIVEYESPFPEPLKIRKGEQVQLTEKKSEWSGWIWCINKIGKKGWVPRSYLRIQDNQATLLQDYDATELTAKIGEEFVIEEEESSWFLVTGKDDRKGWIPIKNVEVFIK